MAKVFRDTVLEQELMLKIVNAWIYNAEDQVCYKITAMPHIRLAAHSVNYWNCDT